MDRKTSYTAAGALPLKLFRNKDFLEAVEHGRIPPIHIQFIPTNRCNLKCSFCSCANRNTHLEMRIEEIEEMISYFAKLGTKACTITGGGEPILHKDFDNIVESFYAAGIKMGLVSNGVALKKVKPETLRKLTWCRISLADERELPDISEPIRLAPNVDWAFSYVLSTNPNIERIKEAIRFAEDHDFTHIRIVADLLHPDEVPTLQLEEEIASPLIIWQPRTDDTPGRMECRISLLKPVIGPDGQIFPCCGVQYAREEYDLDLPPDMSMGHWRDMDIMSYFDGSKCVRCWYDNYNEALEVSLSELEHKDFV